MRFFHFLLIFQTIYHVILINELSSPLRNKSELLTDLNSAITSELIGLHQSIQSALDFSTKIKAGRPIIKFGIDCDLDASKFNFQKRRMMP